MKHLFTLLLLCPLLVTAANTTSNPFQTEQSFKPKGRLDELMLECWNKNNLKPAKMSSDSTFIRRVYLDLIGKTPTVEETKAFLADKAPDKRSKLIDSLLERKEFAMYWSLKWCDILRVKSEFPINLWPNAVQAYHHWVWDSIRKNKPYNQFARELLTGSGSNFREAQVNFYRSTRDRTPKGFAKVAVQAFLCSDFTKWPEYNREEVEKLFSRVAIKGTDEWKEQIVYLNPEPVDEMEVTMPDGSLLKVSPEKDPRGVFADWLMDSKNMWFEEAAVNRLWFWLFGRGMVHDPDDFQLRNKDVGLVTNWFGNPPKDNKGNPPSSPEVMKYLAEQFSLSGYDFKALCKLITNSATYQQSCIPAGNDLAKAEKYFAVYPVRRIDAEVLRDTMTYLTGFKPKYMSVIPEPFTFIPGDQPTIALADGSITSAFLENFGRPARDTGLLTERNNETTYSQRLFLLNSPLIQWKIVSSPKIKELMKDAKGDPKKVIDNIYLFILSREATEEEIKKLMKLYGIKPMAVAVKELRAKKTGKNKTLDKKDKAGLARLRKQNAQKFKNAGMDLVWTLVNTKEFLFKH